MAVLFSQTVHRRGTITLMGTLEAFIWIRCNGENLTATLVSPAPHDRTFRDCGFVQSMAKFQERFGAYADTYQRSLTLDSYVFLLMRLIRCKGQKELPLGFVRATLDA